MADVYQEEREAGASTQRVKLSDALLVDLYRHAADPEGQIPVVRGLKVIILVSVVSLVAFCATLFYNYNTFVYLHEDVLNKWGNLESAIQRRSNLFANLVKLTLNHAALEHSIYSHAADVRTEIIKKSDLPASVAKELVNKATADPGKEGAINWEGILGQLAGDQGMNSSLGRLLGLVEQYPNVRSSETYQHVMTALVEMEDRIVVAREHYNTAARDYNAAITKFPWKVLAEWTQFGRAEYFNGQNAPVAPMITPGMFQELLPYVAVKGEQKREDVGTSADPTQSRPAQNGGAGR
ncbi:MAG: magnetosome protein MamQ [Alphaproteobacteria bacterium]